MKSIARTLAVAAMLFWSTGNVLASEGEPVHAEAAEHGSAHGVVHESGHDEAAGHGEHSGFSTGTFALQLVNFGCLLFIIIYFGGRAFNKSLRARHEQLKSEIGDAARARDEAKAKFEAQERRVAELEKEVATLRESMRQDAQQEQARALEAAQVRAKRVQEEMRFQIDQQVKQAEAILRAEVSSAAVALADELVRKTVSMDDQRRLAQEFVAGFGGEVR